jgi:hypothetical protein
MRAREAASCSRAWALASAWPASSAKWAIRCSVPVAADDVRGRAGDGRVVVDAYRRPGLPYARHRRVAVHRHVQPHRQPVLLGERPVAHDRAAPAVRVEAEHVRPLRLEQPPELLADDPEQRRRVALRRHRGGHAAQRRLLLGQPVQRRLGPLARGDVAQVPEELRRPGGLRPRHHQLDGKLRAVRAHRGQLHAPAHHRPAAAALEVPGEPAAVRLAQGGRDDQLGHLAADHLLAGVAERLLGGPVDIEHAPVRAHGDHGVEGRVEQRPPARLVLGVRRRLLPDQRTEALERRARRRGAGHGLEGLEQVVGFRHGPELRMSG